VDGRPFFLAHQGDFCDRAGVRPLHHRGGLAHETIGSLRQPRTATRRCSTRSKPRRPRARWASCARRRRYRRRSGALCSMVTHGSDVPWPRGRGAKHHDRVVLRAVPPRRSAAIHGCGRRSRGARAQLSCAIRARQRRSGVVRPAALRAVSQQARCELSTRERCAARSFRGKAALRGARCPGAFVDIGVQAGLHTAAARVIGHEAFNRDGCTMLRPLNLPPRCWPQPARVRSRHACADSTTSRGCAVRRRRRRGGAVLPPTAGDVHSPATEARRPMRRHMAAELVSKSGARPRADAARGADHRLDRSHRDRQRYGLEQVFARQLGGKDTRGRAFLGITTSGTSAQHPATR